MPATDSYGCKWLQRTPGAEVTGSGGLVVSVAVKCRRGDLNPHAPQGALGPQPSASTKFRHSDVARSILPTAPARPERRDLVPLPREPEDGDAPHDRGDHGDPVERPLEGRAAGEIVAAAEHVRQTTPLARVHQDRDDQEDRRQDEQHDGDGVDHVELPGSATASASMIVASSGK